MAFPETILPILVDISLDGTTWTDITSDVRRQQQVRISRGRSDWGQQVDFGRCNFALTNTDGKYTPRRPESPYYGQIGRNTPVRISVLSGSVAALVPGATGDFISTPDTGVLDITGDLDVRLDATLANWVLADYSIIEAGFVVSSRTELIGKSTLGQRSWNLYVLEGNLMLEWSTDGSAQITQESTEPLPVPASGRLAVRATLDVNNGASGYDVKFYTSDSIDGVWAQLGSTVTGVGTTSIFSGTAPVRIADSTSTVYTEAIGYVHAAEIRTGIGDAGTVIADPRFSEQASGTTSFADDAGRTWTVAGQTEISSRKIRFVGEITNWPSRWETGGFDVVAEVEASGLLRRLGKGAVPAKSPVYREFTAPSRTSIVGYWPMEDEAEATELGSAISGHPGLRITGTVTPAAYSDWVASAPLPEIGTGSLRVNMPTYTATTATFMRMFVAVPAAGVVSTQRLISFTTTGTARTWSLYVTTSGGLELEAYDADGTQILNPGPVAFAVNGKKKSLGIELTQSGANIEWDVFSLDLDDSTLTSASASSTGATLNSYTVGTVTQIRLGEDGAMNDTAVGHLAVATDSAAFGSTLGPLIGWDGEIAASRIHRLGFEERFHSYATRIGDEHMGVQTRAAILDLLRQAEGVDEGILCEQRDLLGLRYVQRRSLYNQLPDLVLDYEGKGLVTPLDPEEDDQSLANDVTVQRSGGSSARLTLDEGPLSTQAPPNGVGLYDTSHTLSLYDDTQPPFHAGWKLHLGTWDELRFPVVSVNLAAAPELIDDAASVDIGSRMQITNPPAWLPPDTLDLMVQGYTEVFDQTSWSLAFNCTPAGPYSVAFEGDGIYDRADTDGSELAEDLTTTETPVDVMVTEGPVWVTAPAPLNSNTSFQTDTTGWSGFGSTIERVPIPGNPPFIGLWALEITPDGVEQYPNAGGDQVPVTVGASYTLTGWLRCATSRSVALNINWFDGGGYLATSSNDMAVVKNEWTFFEVTAPAPVGAVTANPAPTVPDFPPSTDVLWCTHVMIRPEGGSPEEFPFDVRVGGEVARVIGVGSAAADTFTRTASASTWGTPTTGSAWVNTGGVAADHYTTGTEGAHRLTAVDVARLDLTAISGTDALVQADIATAALATGGPQLVSLVARAVDGDNCYMAQLSISTAQVITLSIRKRAAGVESELGSYTTRNVHSAFAFFRLQFQAIGSELKARVWAVGALSPDWQVEVSEGALTSGSNVGCRSVRQTANTNANLIVSWDNFELLSPQTFTVIRSINGVTKTHSAGADLRLAYPAYPPL
jgi:flagellar hook protein FlgE